MVSTRSGRGHGVNTVLVFDLNETLLDISSLDVVFSRLFGDPQTRKMWFRQVVELFMTATIIDDYQSFDKLSENALEMLASARGVELTDVQRADLRQALGTLPAHPDVRPGLERLLVAGFRIFTLTNSTEKAATALIEQAGLSDTIERILSVDAIHRYKPAREAYEYAAEELGVPLSQMRLVAAHSWDVAGALKAGCAAAFVARPERALSRDGPQPDLVVRDIAELADRLIGPKH